MESCVKIISPVSSNTISQKTPKKIIKRKIKLNDKADTDLQETKEWIESLEAVIENSGNERAHFLVEQLVGTARRLG